MPSILPLDELNRIDGLIRERFGYNTLQNRKEDEEYVEDILLELFEMAYAMGNGVTNENLGSDYTPTKDEENRVINSEVAGKTWKERVGEYFSSGGTGADISRIADTEMHRIANTAALNAAKRAGATSKTWVTMMDDRVRDSHDYLLGVTVGINEDFWTWDGSHAPAPGLFGVPEEDINCRCELLFA